MAPKQPELSLINYDAARRALAKTERVDEAKKIRSKAVALVAYAKQAQDRELLTLASKIKLRAERRAGELLKESAQTGQRQKQGGDKKSKSDRSTLIHLPKQLKELGVSKQQSSDWQQLAAIPEAEFERRLSPALHDSAALTTHRILYPRPPRLTPRQRAVHDALQLARKQEIEKLYQRARGQGQPPPAAPPSQGTPMILEFVNLADLQPDFTSCHAQTDENVALVRESLVRFGQQVNLVITTGLAKYDGRALIVKGTAVYFAARTLQWEGLWCYRTAMSELERARFNIVDNRSSELALWEWDEVRLKIMALMAAGQDVTNLGFTEYELIPLMMSTYLPSKVPGQSSLFDNPDALFKALHEDQDKPAPPEGTPATATSVASGEAEGALTEHTSVIEGIAITDETASRKAYFRASEDLRFSQQTWEAFHERFKARFKAIPTSKR